MPDLADLLSLAVKAVDAFEDGHPEAAQSLGTAVLDTSITQYFAPEGPRQVRMSIDEIRKMAARSGTDEEYWRYLLAITMAGIPPAWQGYVYGSEEPDFNRHGTFHAAALTVYSPTNAVRVLTLATTLLRSMKQNEDLLTDEDGQGHEADADVANDEPTPAADASRALISAMFSAGAATSAGGSFGVAAASGATGAVVDLAVGLREKWLHRRSRSALAALEQAGEIVGGLEILNERAQADDERLELTAKVLRSGCPDANAREDQGSRSCTCRWSHSASSSAPPSAYSMVETCRYAAAVPVGA